MAKTYLVTGGAGFIGSNFVLYMLHKYGDIKIVNVDLLTYAGNLENLASVEGDDRHAFVQADIRDAQAISDATVRARKEVLTLAAGLARLGGPWKGFRVAATAEQIGHRDARRIHGRYTVTRDDVTAGARFPDAVTTSRFGIDIHGLDKKANDVRAAGQSFGVKFRPFQIPLRACRAKDADNLYMAGRCISGDFYAHASYRVTGSAVAIGEAVGKAAARQAAGQA